MKLVFEWDERKAQLNLKKHQISFEEAKSIFNDPLLLTYRDDLHSESEERHVSTGCSCRRQILLVVHTEQIMNNELLIRIISGRKATNRERANYENATE